MESKLIIGILQLIIEELPTAIPAIRALLTKENPTDADFDAAIAQIDADSYDKLVPTAKLLKEEPPPQPS